MRPDRTSAIRRLAAAGRSWAVAPRAARSGGARARRALAAPLVVLLAAACAGGDGGADATATGSPPPVSAAPSPGAGPGRAASDPGASAGPGSTAGTPDVPPLHPSVDDWPTARVTLTGPDGATRTVDVLVADTPERARHGLMEVPDVPDGVGMLFPFGSPRRVAFTMRNTLTGLDLAFFDGRGRLVDLVTLEPCPEGGPDCPGHAPSDEVADVLEVRAGWFADQGLGPGTELAVSGRG